MAESNKDKIQKVLSEQFNKYRYIFWYDAEGAMEELVMRWWNPSKGLLESQGYGRGMRYYLPRGVECLSDRG